MLSRKSTSRDRLAAVGYNRHGAMGRFWHGLHRHALMTMVAYAFLQHFRIAKTGRKNETTATTSAQPASRASRHRRSHSSAIRSAIRILQNTGQRRARREQICQSRVSARPKRLYDRAGNGRSASSTRWRRAICPRPRARRACAGRQ